MSLLFDAPVHLVMVLSAVVAGQEPASPDPRIAPRTESEVSYGFSDAVWLAALHKGFGGTSVGAFRDRIFTTSGGRIYVPILAERQEILKARRHAAPAHAVAVDLARYHFVELRRRLGQSPGVKELYAAHVLGLELAAQLYGLLQKQPAALIAETLPEITAVFPEITTRGLTIADFYQRLPDGAEGFVTAARTPAKAVSGMATTKVMVSAAHLQVDRAAPLRGVIADLERSAAVESEQLATLEVRPDAWVAHVQRAN